jgi:hypothetical protein
VDLIYSLLSARYGRGRGTGRLVEDLAEHFGFWPAVGIVFGGVILITVVSRWLKSGDAPHANARAQEPEHHQTMLPPLPDRDGPPQLNG